MSPGDSPRIGFLGTGHMATALAKGWLAAGLARADRMMGSDPVPAAREKFQSVTGAKTVLDNRQVVVASDVLVIAVKPQSIAPLLAEIRPSVTVGHLIVSIAAGITLRQLAEGLGTDRR